MSLVEGEIAGAAAVGRPADRRQLVRLRRERRFQRLYGELFAARPGLVELADAATVVCRCEEATRADVDAALARGATTAAMAKSLSRCGMGPCQGRVCGPIVAQLVEQSTGVAQVPLTARPPLVPVPLASLAGALAEPTP
jgi:NAD(P)H-nitrite reductase large subunit